MQYIYLVRHGTTEYMETSRVQGATDSPLSARGKREAEQAASALLPVEFDAVFCSPLGRTRETAGIICARKNIKPQIINDLREMDFGRFEGSTHFNLPPGKTGLWKRLSLFVMFIFAQLSGESLKNVKRRAKSALHQIRQRCPEGTILIVAHGMLITCMLGTMPLQNQIEDIKSLRLKPCNITEIFVEDSGLMKVIRLNATEHLSE